MRLATSNAATSDWSLDDAGGVTVARCRPLDRVPGIGHAFSTRRGPGAEPFDLGTADSDDAAVVERRRALCAAAGLGRLLPARMRQVHGTLVLDLADAAEGPTPEADGVFGVRGADRGAWAPAVRTADCVPLLLARADGSAVAAVHAGWRGTAGGIVGEAVRRLTSGGEPASDLVAAVGPAIGPCCYEVGDEVRQAVERASEAGAGELSTGRCLDLKRANWLQLRRVGLAEAAIHVAPWCTFCEPELFFSYRREKRLAGRMMACVGFAPSR